MDFLDLCERVADYDRQERALRERQQRAQACGDRQQYAQVSDELDDVGIEKRLTMRKALDWPGRCSG